MQGWGWLGHAGVGQGVGVDYVGVGWMGCGGQWRGGMGGWII